MKRKRWLERLFVQRIAGGDADACAELVRAHHADIYGFALHLCHDEHVAQDITQETFTAAWSRIGSFNGSCALGTWLHRIAYNKFVDRHRQARHSDIDPANLLPARQSSDPGPLENLLADEQSEHLHQAIARLAAPARQTIILHYFQGLSYREMAFVIDEPVGTIKWRTSRALAQLKRLMQPGPDNENER